mmetsp:Transcript_7230/g.12001  ORF Transcript_7230/g.12001 Transcript_7230/m.12001 type:complete len:399 (-) Transcript_7230:7-1203(-)
MLGLDVDINGCFGVIIENGKLATSLGTSPNTNANLLAFGDINLVCSAGTNVKRMRKQSLHVSRRRLVHCINRRWTSATIVGWNLIFLRQFLQFLLPFGTRRINIDLTGRAGINVSLNDTPCCRKKGGSIDNDHFGHGFWKAKGINKGLFLNNGERAGSELGNTQIGQIQNANGLKASKALTMDLLSAKATTKVVHHEKPMKFENAIKCGNAIDGINVQNTWFGEKEWNASLIISRIDLRELRHVESHVTTQSLAGFFVKVIGLGSGTALGCFLDHGNDIVVDIFTSTEPSAKAPHFTLLFAKVINGGSEISIIAFVNFVFEFRINVSLFLRQMTRTSPKHWIFLGSISTSFTSIQAALAHQHLLIPVFSYHLVYVCILCMYLYDCIVRTTTTTTTTRL